MEMYSKKRFIVRVDSCYQQLPPEHNILLPSGTQTLAVSECNPFHLQNREVGYLRAHAGCHSKKQVRDVREDPLESPHFHQDLPEERLRLPLVRKEGLWRSVPHDNRSAAHPFPPIETLKVQVEQQHRASGRPVASSLIYVLPQFPFPIDRASFDWSTFRSNSVCQHRKAFSVQSVQRRFCPQTGPPVRRWRSVIPFHFPIRSCGYGGGFSKSK